MTSAKDRSSPIEREGYPARASVLRLPSCWIRRS